MKRKQQAEASRARLVEAARQLFAREGYQATTVAAVLERAGMARGALYHYFPGGKRDLFEAVFDRINEAFHRDRDALLELESPLARVRAGIRLFLAHCTEAEFARIALVDAATLVPGQAGRGSSYERLLAQLREAVAAGELAGVDAEPTARALYGAARSAGEFVFGSRDREAALAAATRSLDRIVDGLAGPVAELAATGPARAPGV